MQSTDYTDFTDSNIRIWNVSSAAAFEMQKKVEDRSGFSYSLSWRNTSADTRLLLQALRIANGVKDMRLSRDVLEEVWRSRAHILKVLDSRGAEIEVGAIEITLAAEEHTSTPYAGFAIIVVATLAVAGAWRCRRARKLTQRRGGAETQR